MSLVTVTNTLHNADGTPLVGAPVSVTLCVAAFDGTGAVEIIGTPSYVTTDATGLWTFSAEPNSTQTPAGTYYTIREPSVTHVVTVPPGGPYLLSALPVVTSPPLPPSSALYVQADVVQTFTAGQQAQARANIGAGTGGGGVTSFNTRVGAVVPTTGDYTAAQVGADAAGLAAAETARATAAEALLAPKASPALTGTPTAPTAAALDNTTKIATTAYADTATGVEKARALAAEALLAPLASPALTGTPTAPTQTAGNNSTRLATTAYTDGAVSTETTARTTADGLLVPKTRTLAGLDLTADRTAAALKTALAIGESDVTNLTTDLAAKVPLSTVTTKGDLIVGTGAGAVTNLPVGADGQVPVADSTQAGGMKWASPPIGRRKSGLYYGAARSLAGNGAASYPNGQMIAQPFPVANACTILNLGLGLTGTAGSAGSVIRLGIYSDSNGQPGALLIDGGTINGTLTGSHQNLTISQAVGQGLYWVITVSQGAPATNPTYQTAQTVAFAAEYIGADTNDKIHNASQYGSYATSAGAVTGALPGTFPAFNYTSSPISNLPAVSIGIA